MLYGFITEDIICLNERDPLSIQIRYAHKIGKYCEVDLKRRIFKDGFGNKISVHNQNVMLRASCDNLLKGMETFEENGAILFETIKDVENIERWYKLGALKRKVFEIDFSDIANDSIKIGIMEYLSAFSQYFLKSLHKGFSCVVGADRFLQKDEMFMNFLKRQSELWGNQLIISGYNEIKQDSLGKKESRHIIIDGQVMNSSRQFIRLVHNVPRSHIDMAKRISEQLKNIKGFPLNYILDLGEFCGEDNYIDIIELNPVTTGLCFINNSIFFDDVVFIPNRIKNMGIEYCYDYMENPGYYFLNRVSNRNYTYLSNDHYGFS